MFFFLRPIQIFSSYAHADEKLYQSLSAKLKEAGAAHAISIFFSDDSEAPMANDSVENQIASSDVFLLLLTENSICNQYVLSELKECISIAESRDKKILSILLHGQNTFNSIGDRKLQKIIEQSYCFCQENVDELAESIAIYLSQKSSKELLLSKISGLKQINYESGIAEPLIELLSLLYNEMKLEVRQNWFNKITYLDLYLYLEELDCKWCKLYLDYTEKSRETAKNVTKSVKEIAQIVFDWNPDDLDLFMTAVAITVVNFIHSIACNCVDTITYGDVHSPSLEWNNKINKFNASFCPLFNQLFEHEGGYIDSCPDSERRIIEYANSHSISYLNGNYCTPSNSCKQVVEAELSDTEKSLYEVAMLISKSNQIFNTLGHGDHSIHYYRCLKLSYERLQNLCLVSNFKAIAAECVKHISELQEVISSCDHPNVEGSMEEDAIHALLGTKDRENSNWDVFISHKSESRDIANNVYNFLKENLLIPFFDDVSLPVYGDSEYERAIYDALDHSKHFVVILTDMKDLYSKWVDLEMRTFHHEMIEGRKKNANFLILATDQIYSEIVKTGKTTIPIEYRQCEIMQLSHYREKIISYLKND